MLDFLRFYAEVPVLAYSRYSSPLSNSILLFICLILVVFGIFTVVATNDPNIIKGLFSGIRVEQLNEKTFTIVILTLVGIVLTLLFYGEYKKMPIVDIFKSFREGKIHYVNKQQGYGDPKINPSYDIATPADIMNSLREDDMNTLMFGRSKFPTDAMTENSEGGEILRGYDNSSKMGEQYGTFTGMTLYGGPEMFDQRDIRRVWKDLENIEGPQKRKMSPELILLRNEYNNITEKLSTVSNEGVKNKLMREQKDIKKKIFEKVLKERNETAGIMKEEEMSLEDFKNVVG
tara:strand:+ start:1021 stop:1887 length:867 start_codon:yes stop_codon:yes gene_type:complete